MFKKRTGLKRCASMITIDGLVGKVALAVDGGETENKKSRRHCVLEAPLLKEDIEGDALKPFGCSELFSWVPKMSRTGS